MEEDQRRLAYELKKEREEREELSQERDDLLRRIALNTGPGMKEEAEGEGKADTKSLHKNRLMHDVARMAQEVAKLQEERDSLSHKFSSIQQHSLSLLASS